MPNLDNVDLYGIVMKLEHYKRMKAKELTTQQSEAIAIVVEMVLADYYKRESPFTEEKR